MKEFDKQTTGIAGEFLTAGKLCKRGLQATVTLGNAKAIDILAHNPTNEKTYTVQVKTMRTNEDFFLQEKNIQEDYIFVFIVLNEFEKDEDYFIVKGAEILNDVKKFFGTTYNRENPSDMSAVRHSALKGYKDNWNVFDQ